MAKKKLWNIDIETLGSLSGSLFTEGDLVSMSPPSEGVTLWGQNTLESNPCGEVLLGELNHMSDFSFDFDKLHEYLESIQTPSKDSLYANTADDLISAWEDKQESRWRFFLPMAITPFAPLGQDLVSVQPMAAPIGTLYYSDFKYESYDCPICQTLDKISHDEIERL